MGRFLFFLAFLLLGAGIFIFVILLTGPENEWAKTIFETTICEDGEEFTQWIGNYIPRRGSSSGGYETAFYCRNSAGNERDVTLNAIGLIAGSFAIPLILSLLLFFIAGGMMVNNRMKAATGNVFDLSGGSAVWTSMTQPQTSTTVIDLRDGSYQGSEIPAEKMAQAQQILSSFGLQNVSNVTMSSSSGEIPAEKMAQVQQILSSFGFNNVAATGTGGSSLTERLQEVENARKQGLISQSEYERLRQDILDNLNN